jgi:hypothetical protein
MEDDIMKLNPDKLTDDERNLICLCINKKGDGQHPCAEPHNLKYFEDDYAVACIDKAMVFLNKAGAAVACAAKAKILNEAMGADFVEKLHHKLNDVLGE